MEIVIWIGPNAKRGEYSFPVVGVKLPENKFGVAIGGQFHGDALRELLKKAR